MHPEFSLSDHGMPAGFSKGRHRRHANPFSLRHEVQRLDVEAHFGRQAHIALDIGCGPGAFVLALARARPQDNVLGLEIRPHLVEVGRAQLQADNLAHADVLLANANLHLDALLPDHCVSMVSINFADPWFKKRHHKRRVVTDDLSAILMRKLVPHGEVHVMTDVEALARVTRRTLAQAHFVDANPPDKWPATSTTGLQSERERWHVARGDAVWRMCFSAPSLPTSKGAKEAFSARDATSAKA